jgi:hypothetical protein
MMNQPLPLSNWWFGGKFVDTFVARSCKTILPVTATFNEEFPGNFTTAWHRSNTFCGKP